MKKLGGGRPCGFTVLELVVVIIVISTVLFAVLEKVWAFQEALEETAMLQTVVNIKSALRFQVAGLMLQNKIQELPKLARENPMNWMLQVPWEKPEEHRFAVVPNVESKAAGGLVPRNYAGEYYDPNPGDIAPGNWYFDLKDRHLVYLINRGDHFVPGPEGKKWVRFRLNYSQGAQAGGIVFEADPPFVWFNK